MVQRRAERSIRREAADPGTWEGPGMRTGPCSQGSVVAHRANGRGTRPRERSPHRVWNRSWHHSWPRCWKRGSAWLAWLTLAASCSPSPPESPSGAPDDARGNAETEAGSEARLLDVAGTNFGTDYRVAFDTALKAATSGPPPGSAIASSGGDPAPRGDEAPTSGLELELRVLRTVSIDGRVVPVALEDGDVLRDGIGRREHGDDLKIEFRASEPLHLYLVWVDSTGWAEPLFPFGAAGSFENPITPAQTYTLPPDDEWWYLDEARGVENLIVVASREPVQELGDFLAKQVARDPKPAEAQLTHLSRPSPLQRGLAGTRPGRAHLVRTPDGNASEVLATRFLGEPNAERLVLTRWFRHE